MGTKATCPQSEAEMNPRGAKRPALSLKCCAALGSFVGGPYRPKLQKMETRPAMSVMTEDGAQVAMRHFSLGPLRVILKCYTQIYECYNGANPRSAPDKLEASDPSMYNEAAKLLHSRLDVKVALDAVTARFLFSLIFLLGHAEDVFSNHAAS